MCTLCPPRHRRKVVRFDSFVDTISYSEYSQYASNGNSTTGSVGEGGCSASSSMSSFTGYKGSGGDVVVAPPRKVDTAGIIVMSFTAAGF
ncbi:hypothetical protein E2C01_032710 [Portunus trituberculatus]|uniref:Uncharacterized protein n=1 Tax=Portunus trituberculatus TaxID=210409 RepID=A0A5B7F0B5_PORTR|nr:hypothetical protein [Portunus trituberculatus]